MDNELKQLAALALRNAFYTDFSTLVNIYLKASEGLGVYQEDDLDNLTSIHGRIQDITGDANLNIWTKYPEGNLGWETIIEALEHKQATEVHLNGEKVFVRVDGEWNLYNQ